MEKRETAFNQEKEVSSQTKKITLIWIAIIVIMIIGTGFLSTIFSHEMSDTQYELCEQIAQSVYEQKNQVIAEIPDDYSVTLTATSITIMPTSRNLRGRVIANLKNDELVFTRDPQIDIYIAEIVIFVLSWIFLAVIIVLLSNALVNTYHERRKEYDLYCKNKMPKLWNRNKS